MKDARLKQTLLNKKNERGDNVVNFSVGDYVLRSRVDEKQQNKLLVTWVGPYVVTEEQEHAFIVKSLVTGDEMAVHASRLKFFADKDLEVTEELREHVAAQGIVLRVEEMLEHRWNESSRDFEIKVHWHGLEAIEDSWEPLKSLFTDVPVLVQQFIDASSDQKLQERLAALKRAAQRK